MKTSPEWYYRINLLASGTYPWCPCSEEEAKKVQETGYVTLPSGVRFPAIAVAAEEIENELA